MKHYAGESLRDIRYAVVLLRYGEKTMSNKVPRISQDINS